MGSTPTSGTTTWQSLTGDGKRMRTWNLLFLVRHSAYHTMDHAWEMEDNDLSALTE